MSQYEIEEYENRVMDQINLKYNSVMVFYGNDEYQISGTTKITRNIFHGTSDRNENAIVFLENLEKIKQNKHFNTAFSGQKRSRQGVKGGHGPGSICGMSMISYDTAANRDDETSTIRHQQFPNGYDSASGFESLDPIDEGYGYDGASDSQHGDEVLLNVSPQKYEKPKD